MRPLSEMSAAEARAVTVVCTDIDDTLTQNGRLLDEAYHAMWRLHNAGVRVLPVTGRPAGWCDLIARQWPVAAVVGENGAFVTYMDDEVMMEYVHPSIPAARVREKLEEVRESVLARVPGSRVAKDQPYRRFDLAIDFCEEPPRLGLEEARRIADVCREHGAECKISSIHVNTWFGRYSKRDMTVRFLKDFYGMQVSSLSNAVLYCGDSPNDEPMFEQFPLSCGVANIRGMLGLIQTEPRFVTTESHGRGFAELVDHVLRLR